MISFKQRVEIFQNLLKADKKDSSDNFWPGRSSNIGIEIRRDHIIEDTYSALINRTDLKGRIRIEFKGEVGIDGGGLFKDFIDNFTKSAFDPTIGYFIPTSEQLLTPNPGSSLLSSEHLGMYYLFGKVLGKAVYEVGIICLFTAYSFSR